MKAIINMTSDVFGTETFEYDTLIEAKKGFNRLVTSCKIHEKADKIHRELQLIFKGETRAYYKQ